MSAMKNENLNARNNSQQQNLIQNVINKLVYLQHFLKNFQLTEMYVK